MKLILNQLIEYAYPATNQVINEPSQDRILHNLNSWGYPPLPTDWLWNWVISSKDRKQLGGDYVGTLPKRISSYYHTEHGVQLKKSELEYIGDVAKKGHNSQNEKYIFQFVNKFNWNAGDFGDSNSCYFVRSGTPLRVLEENGILAVCFYSERGRYTQGHPITATTQRQRLQDSRDDLQKDIHSNWGLARAWVIPDFPEMGMITLFNGYGFTGDSLLTISRVLSMYFSVSYCQVIAYNQGRTAGVVYINTGTRRELDGTRISKPRATILGTSSQLSKYPFNSTILELGIKDTSDYYTDVDLEY